VVAAKEDDAQQTDPEDAETAAVVTTGDQRGTRSAADPNWRKMTLRTGDQAFTVTVYDDRIDPFIACYDILLAVGVGSSHFRREMKFEGPQIEDLQISEMTPPRMGGNGGLQANAVPFVRLSKFIPFINTVKKAAPLRNLFNGSAVRYLAGNPTLAHDTAAIGAAHALLADLDPDNFMCLFGDASRRAAAGEDVPALSIARAATAVSYPKDGTVDVSTNPSDNPENNRLSNWSIMHAVLPAEFMQTQKKESDRREHRTPVRVRKFYGPTNIEDDDPLLELGDVLDGLGVNDPSNRAKLVQNFIVVKNTTMKIQAPEMNLSRLHRTTSCIRLSQLRSVIVNVNTLFGKVFLDVISANGLRMHAGDRRGVEDAAKHRAAMQNLMATDPTNLQCLFGAAADRANAGLSSPMIDEARAAGATGTAILGERPPAAGPSGAAAAPEMTVANMTETNTANLKLVIYDKELDLEKDRPGFMDHAHGLFMEKLHEDLRVHCEKVDKNSADRAEDVAAHAAKVDKDSAAHTARSAEDVAAHAAKVDKDVAARVATLAAEDQAKAAEHARNMAMMQIQLQMAANNAVHVSNRDHGDRSRDAKRHRGDSRRDNTVSRSPSSANRSNSVSRHN
jgi:hypothetical protein